MRTRMATGPGARHTMPCARREQRCWRHDWVLDLDIKGFFDNIDHELLMRGGAPAYGLPLGAAVHRAVAQGRRAHARRNVDEAG